MKEQYGQKDLLAKKMDQESGESKSNWLLPEEVNKIIEKVRILYPEAEIEYSGEFFLVRKQNGNIQHIPRWKEVPRTKDDGKTVFYIKIIDAIKEALEE